MTKTLKLIPVAALVMFAAGGSAFAADLPKDGTYDITACISGGMAPITFSKTHSAYTIEQTGTTLSNPPGGFLDKGSFHCIGFRTSFGGSETSETVCESMLPDGGKLLSTFSAGADGKTNRKFLTGTGKYEGIVASGIGEPMGLFPTIKAGTFQTCNHQTGTYKLK